MAACWIVKEHVINASVGRDYPRSVRNEETDRLRLAVKQWTPILKQRSQSDEVSIVFCHGVGSTKESYEPYFDELLGAGTKIRSVWAMDVCNHGESFVLNETFIGDEPSWGDCARDIVQMINTLDIKPPIIGIAQSWGPAYLMMAASFHPRLFAGIVALEPAFSHRYSKTPASGAALWIANKRDTWPSIQRAREDLRSSVYFKPFDARVFEKIMTHDLRYVDEDIQTEPSKRSDSSERAVTFKTPKIQEVYIMLRQDCILPGFVSGPTNENEETASRVVGDLFRPEAITMEKLLPSLYPPVLYVWGSASHIYQLAGYRKFVEGSTGIGQGGSGGVKAGKVSTALVDGANHPLPLEKPYGTAMACYKWINEIGKQWLEETREARQAPFHTTTMHPTYRKKLLKL